MSNDDSQHSRRSSRWTGRCFLHPAFDYLVIGGGLSLIVIPAIYLVRQRNELFGIDAIPWFILASNSAHFAASSVRLYTKPGAVKSFPFVSLGLPLAMLAVLLTAMFWPVSLGKWLHAVYLAWSPYHYSAQAYGLAVMYCYRSGVKLSLPQKRLLWGIALLPFVKVAITTFAKHVVYWVLPAEQLWPPPQWLVTLRLVGEWAGWAGLAMVPLAGIWFRWKQKLSIPLISLLVAGSNAVWFTLFSLIDGFVWATMFHGIQYLAIVSIFHVQDHCPATAPVAQRAWTTVRFYVTCLALGYSLFNCVPLGFQALGFGAVESVLLVAATINIHHFLVDGYIWKLGRADSNRRIVDAVAA